MTEEFIINNAGSDTEIYEQLIPQIDSIVSVEEPIISNLANVTAALKQCFKKISWVGFYLAVDEKLCLGPFQGNVACTIIPFGKGVCGTSALKKETIIVSDVEKFPGHIACDSGSKSEIVVPIILDGNVAGVLDLDSYNYTAFNETDKFFLEQIIKILISKLDFCKFHLT